MSSDPKVSGTPAQPNHRLPGLFLRQLGWIVVPLKSFKEPKMLGTFPACSSNDGRVC